MHMGVVPFLPGEVIKVAAAAGLYSAGRTLSRS
jgi:biotin transporter BioY